MMTLDEMCQFSHLLQQSAADERRELAEMLMPEDAENRAQIIASVTHETVFYVPARLREQVSGVLNYVKYVDGTLIGDRVVMMRRPKTVVGAPI